MVRSSCLELAGAKNTLACAKMVATHPRLHEAGVLTIHFFVKKAFCTFFAFFHHR
jgi:hypothetical protein